MWVKDSGMGAPGRTSAGVPNVELGLLNIPAGGSRIFFGGGGPAGKWPSVAILRRLPDMSFETCPEGTSGESVQGHSHDPLFPTVLSRYPGGNVREKSFPAGPQSFCIGDLSYRLMP